MVRPLNRVVDYFATEPVRVAACLRLPMIGLIALLVYEGHIRHWLPEVWTAVLLAYTAAALVWLVIVLRGPVPPWADWASTSIDVLAVFALCVASGAATSWLLPVFFLLPISLAFQNRPALPAAFGAATAVSYLAAWIIYSKRDDTVGLPNGVYVDIGFLVWLAVATTALCYVLARRSAGVRALLEVRRRLVSESMGADERQSRELAEELHDGPLQDLLAARLELVDVVERHADPGLDAVQVALDDAATRLRSTVTALHPHVLAELGLTTALRELVRQFQDRTNIAVAAELEEVDRPPSQSLVYRAARELLANVNKHAQATVVQVRLVQVADRITLTVADDGIGFDPSVLDRCVAQGHIGLASLQIRIDAMGGRLCLTCPMEGGTQASITVPADIRPTSPEESSDVIVD
ncbi:MAG: ATP-binding protein [Mycobacterium sp.]